MRLYQVTFSLDDEHSFQDITYIVAANNREQALDVTEDDRRFSPNWITSVRRLKMKERKPHVISRFVE